MPNPLLPIPEMSVNLFRARPTRAKPERIQPGLLKLLDELPLERKPRLVRGDNAFGNNAMMGVGFSGRLTPDTRHSLSPVPSHSPSADG